MFNFMRILEKNLKTKLCKNVLQNKSEKQINFRKKNFFEKKKCEKTFSEKQFLQKKNSEKYFWKTKFRKKVLEKKSKSA